MKILIIDDEKIYRDELTDFLTNKGFEMFQANNSEIGMNVLASEDIDIVILDYNLPGITGLEVLQKIKEIYPKIEVIMITGFGKINTVIKAMRLGASDFFTKPFKLLNIQASIERTERFLQTKNQLQKTENKFSLLNEELHKKIGDSIIGESKAIKSVIKLMKKIALADKTNVLITGESGTGKELVARGIHFLSKRKNNFFYDVNCSAVPRELFESEFFGHNKGAFTGAHENKAGWFEIADKGTLFLDEIGDLDLSLQTKFLRVLEQNRIRRVGSSRDIKIDVRIIAATNRDLARLIEENEFRSDLYYRFSTFIIHLPPLRERQEDIPVLTNYFVSKLAKEVGKKIVGIDSNALNKLKDYSFPGNIRELKNMIEQAIILSDNETITLSDFPILLTKKVGNNSHNFKIDDWDINNNIRNLEIELIKKAMQKAENNKTKCANLLNITRQSLDRRLDKYSLTF